MDSEYNSIYSFMNDYFKKVAESFLEYNIQYGTKDSPFMEYLLVATSIPSDIILKESFSKSRTNSKILESIETCAKILILLVYPSPFE